MNGEAAHREALLGHFDPDGIARLAAGSAADRGWAAAIQCAFGVAAPDRETPSLDTLKSLATEASAAEPVAVACSHLGRIAWLGGSRESLDQTLHLQATCADTPQAQVELEVNRARGHQMAGSLTSIRDELTALENSASRLEMAHCVVEVAALRALAAIPEDLSEAVKHARRATRMARTEAIPQTEYFAYWTLARIRRLTGKRHLTVRIMRSLHTLVPDRWGRLIGWEMLFAQGPRFTDSYQGSEERGGLCQALAAATNGEAEALMHHAENAIAEAPDSYREETRVCLELLGVELPGVAHPLAHNWIEGTVPEPPLGLQCLRGESMAVMSVAPERRGRRFAGLAAGFLPPVTSSSRPGRIETAFCVLASGEPTHKERFFREVYGFDYDPELHQGSLEVVVHRLRALCGTKASVERANDYLRLSAREPIAMPDPRCESGHDDALLHVLAEGPGGTARDLATAAGIPLRTAQAALKQLVQDGVCVTSRRGRVVEYRLEDTTFSEPTRIGPK